MTLICLAIFTYGVRRNGLHLAAFLVVLVFVVSILVVLDVKANSLVVACTAGKLSPLEEKDPELQETINKEWAALSKGKDPLKCYVMNGQSGHSNCFVDTSRVVIYDSMFEHVRERHHMMGIIRHEMGHALYHHVLKIILMRILYYDLLFIGITFLVKYQESWLPMFGISYNSLFLAMFCIVHFIHYKIILYLYEIVEHTVQRGFEYFCDHFAVSSVSEDDKRHFREAMLIVF